MPETVMRIATEGRRALPKKIPFTLAALTGLRVQPDGDRIWAYDSRTPHLAFLKTAGGATSFYWIGRIQGRPTRYRLGDGNLSIEQARTLAAKTGGKIADGANPHQQRKLARGELSFKELFDLYIERCAKPRKRTWEEDQQKFDHHLHVWSSRPAKSITHADVAALHAKIGTEAPGAANRVLALVSVVFNRAREFGIECNNPAKGVRKFPEHQRDRFLSGDELRRFFGALEQETNQTWKDFFALLLWTGARSGNVKSMRWDELNLADALWTIPAAKFKTDKALIVPLPPQAIKILKSRQDNGSEYVFPGTGNRKADHIREPKEAWEVICNRAGLTDLWIHDLRRTNASWQAAGGSSLNVIGRSLGHTAVATTARYARLDLTPVKVSIDAAAKAMELVAAKKPAKKGKVATCRHLI